MSLKQVADDTVVSLEKVFEQSDLSDEQKQEVSKIIEQTLMQAVEQATKAHHAAAVVCCGPEADMAHKIREEIQRANIALTANLSAMR